MKNLKMLATLFILAAGATARADYIAYDVSPALAGNTNYFGTLGMNFDVLTGSTITVTSLGVFDNGQSAPSVTHDVAIYNRDTGLIVTGASAVITPTSTGTQTGGSFFVTIPSVTLGPGHYTIAADNFVGNDKTYFASFNGNTPPSTLSGSGAIAFVGHGVYTGSNNSFPPVPDGSESIVNPYAAGTFTFTAATVPEPTSIALLGLGTLGLLGLGARRREVARD